ncbi:MAG: heavy-metal-associated domain-containing protein [Chloroflexi bacterium]|nr:heavy-metal-associated domain-containing protein [Chloroflexota bacterium]
MPAKTFTVPNISCEHCVKAIEREVSEIIGVQKVNAQEASKEVTVQWEDPASWEQIKALLVEIEYPPQE